MRDILDVHTHTVASGHAYNSMLEMIHEAQEKGLEVYGITEHAPKMPGTCGEFYFHNLKVVPRKHGDLELLLGVELNIWTKREQWIWKSPIWEEWMWQSRAFIHPASNRAAGSGIRNV